ncbi:response regulator [Skermanella aerolata]|uniref:Response regulator n=1 Tax=Skermanella aerolata TaxID=393310 RepID=A0A512E4P3_9PROT|nr:response regulator [Skermanella aerolata]KJB90087.1 hypothetical protein N826_07365 [Skermanella aerolata KACC 11604]GEO43659.1 response regulator [Skermanella aerolata]
MRILIVENEAIIALCIGLTLQEAGHEVMGPVACLDASLRLAERMVPDLALVDIELDRGGSGIEVARVLLKRWRVMSIYVSARHSRGRAGTDAAVGCLNKPFATQSLIGTVEVARVLRQGDLPASLPKGLDLFHDRLRNAAGWR